MRFSANLNNVDVSVPVSAEKPRKGCWVGVWSALAIVLAAAAVATTVGLLVFYLHPDRNKVSEIPVESTTTGQDSTPATTAPPADYYRLPDNLVPYSYDATLRPNFYAGNIATDSYTNGSVTIHFGVRKETENVVLHAKNLEIAQASILVEGTTASAKQYEVGNTSYDIVREFYTIALNEKLAEGQNYSLYMTFSGPLREDLAGIYLSKYPDKGTDTYIVTSQAQATEARKMLPCFDEPALKAQFNITVERKADWMSFSNTEKESFNISDDWVADKYEPTPPMSTYLLALVISQFQCVHNESRNGTVKVSICARKEYKNQAEFANTIAAEMQDYYEEYYNISYPLPKMEHMAVPDFSAGAMENWGLILYRETALLYDNGSSSAYNQQRVAIVVAHELAHQWFGNLVTPQWWDDIWLNEGFASYMEIICTDHSFPSWNMDGQFVVDDLQGVFATDSLVTSHPIYQPVNDPAQINELFDDIAYSKGASIIRMMRFFLGEDIFRWGVSEYLKSRSYTAAHHLDLFRTLTETAIQQGKSHINVTEIMQTWLLQLGYPVIKVTYNKTDGSVALEQEHFLLDRTQTPPPSPYNYQWIVPISVTSSANCSFENATQDWLRQETGTVRTESDATWVIVNSMQQYYYRVSYDDEMWTALTNQLMENPTMIHINNRAQLIDDSFNLGRAGYLDMERFLNITLYLTKERDYVPWRATWKNIDYLKRMFELSGNFEDLAKYVQQQVKPIYTEIGWDEADSDSHLTKRHRVIVLDLACSFGYEDCLQEASTIFNSWMTHNTTKNPINPNVRAVAYCSGIEAGGSAEWEFAWQGFLNAPSSSEATTLLQAMACTKEVHLLSGYLDKLLSGTDIRRQDFTTVINNVASNPIGRSLAWDFVREHWDKLLEWFSSSAFTLPNIIDAVTRSFSTELELRELETFKTNAKDLSTATRAVEQAIENTKLNINWREKNEQPVADWLKRNLN